MARFKQRPETPDVNAFLVKVRTGDMTAACVMADYLEETGHRLAKSVRRAVAFYQRRVAYFASHDFTRSRWTRHEALDYAHRRLRRTIRNLFGRKWGPLKKR